MRPFRWLAHTAIMLARDAPGRGFAALPAVLVLTSLVPSALTGQSLENLPPRIASSFGWVDLNESSCVDRGVRGVERATLRVLDRRTFYLAATSDRLRIYIHCITHNARFSGPRTLWAVTVAGSAAFRPGPMRDYLAQYMTGNLGAVPPAAPPPVTPPGGGGVGGDTGGGGVSPRLGRIWNEREGIWTGTWTRQQCTTSFDGIWTYPATTTAPAGRTVGTLTIDINDTNDSVKIDRVAGGGTCTYKGKLDGVTVTGTYSCGGGPDNPWSATITGECRQPTEQRRGTDRLGVTWNEEEQGWTGVWTRRGNSNMFDAKWTRPGSNDVVGVLTIEIRGNQVSISRNGGTCNYTGTLGADGVTVTGTYECAAGGHPGPFSWRAVIR